MINYIGGKDPLFARDAASNVLLLRIQPGIKKASIMAQMAVMARKKKPMPIADKNTPMRVMANKSIAEPVFPA